MNVAAPMSLVLGNQGCCNFDSFALNPRRSDQSRRPDAGQVHGCRVETEAAGSSGGLSCGGDGGGIGSAESAQVIRRTLRVGCSLEDEAHIVLQNF